MQNLKINTNELLKKLGAGLTRFYETRDLLSGRVCKDYFKPYEVVVSFPASLGERGFQFSMYYNEIPTAEEIYQDFRKELKDWIKEKSAFCGAYEEMAVKIGKKVLRKKSTQVCYTKLIVRLLNMTRVFVIVKNEMTKIRIKILESINNKAGFRFLNVKNNTANSVDKELLNEALGFRSLCLFSVLSDQELKRLWDKSGLEYRL